MSLKPLTKRSETERAYKLLHKRLVRGARKFTRKLGWQGGGDEHTLYWHPDVGIWAVLEDKYAGKRFWCCYGTDDPESGDNFGITCEINPPWSGTNRRCAGVFAKDINGQVYLAHTGKLGGGRKGVGKSNFLAFYGRENLETVVWPDGQTTEAVIIGRVDGKRLVAHIADFVMKAEQFKALIGSGVEIFQEQVDTESRFTPEFSGPRRPYRIGDPIESRCSHGLVVNGLAAELRARGLDIHSDRPRDLFIRQGAANTGVLFEVKTDLSTSSIYSLIGQLLYHGTCRPAMPRLVAVLPGHPGDRTGEVLSRLGIAALSYKFAGKQTVFENLDEVLDGVGLS